MKNIFEKVHWKVVRGLLEQLPEKSLEVFKKVAGHWWWFLEEVGISGVLVRNKKEYKEYNGIFVQWS